MANTSANSTPATDINETQTGAADTTAQETNVPDDVCVVEGAQDASSLTSVVIQLPPAGETAEVAMQAGHKYFFDAHESDIASYQQQGNDLRVVFENGSVIVLKDYVTATAGDLPSTLAFRDEFTLDLDIVETAAEDGTVPNDGELQSPEGGEEQAQNLLDGVEGVEALEPAAGEEVAEGEPDAEEVAQTEPAAGDEAASVAQIEPAAGEPTGQGPINSGFTFGNPDGADLVGVARTGPLGATSLQYGVDFPTDDLFPFEIDTVPEAQSSEVALDETGLGPISVSDTVEFEFGANGPGVISANGNFSISGSTGATLTSSGVDVVVTNTATGYVGTANGATVFTLTIDAATGEYTFTQYAALDHADPNNPDDVINLVFGVAGTDADGDVANTTITVRVADDAPLISSPMVENIDESALTAGPIVINDALSIDFGQDTPGAVTSNGSSSVSGVTALTTAGNAITITATATGYVGTYNGGADKAFEITINPATGAYTYTQYAALDHASASDIISLQFGVNVTDYDGDATSTTITVNITDSVPSFPPPPPPPGTPDPSSPAVGTGYEVVDETTLGTSASGIVAIEFGADLPGTFQTNGAFSSSLSLSSHGEAITVTETANGYVGTTASGQTVFTLTIDAATGGYTFTQLLAIDHPDATNPDDAIRLVFGVEAEDADGDTATGSITIDVKDDGPTVSAPATLSLDEGDLSGGPAAVSGTLTHDFGADGAGSIDPNGSTSFTGVTALTSGGEAVSISATADGYVGTTASGTTVFTFTLNAATGAYEFTLLETLDHAAGDAAITLNFGVSVTDFDADSVASNIAVRIVDDKPELPGGDNPALGQGYEVVDETNLGPITVDGDVPVNFGEDSPGSLKITAAPSTTLTSGGEAVTYTVTNGAVTGTLANGDVVFTLALDGNGHYEFTQFLPLDHPDTTNPDDTITLNFPIEVSDSDGDVDTGVIRIDIKDDGPIAVDDSNTVAQNTTDVSGNVLANDDVGADVDGSLTKITFNGVDYDVTPGTQTTVTGQYGTLVIGANGAYTYTSFGTNAANVVDQFTYTLTDADGDSDTAVLKINVEDVDSNPILATPAPLTVDETDLNPTDTDSNVVRGDFGYDGPGTFSVSGTGTFSFSGQAGPGLTSGGVPVELSVDGNDYVGTANGTEVFRLSLNPSTGAYEFTLKGVLDHADTTNPDDVIKLNFGVTATDTDGDTANGTIVVNVKDDGPLAHDDVNTVDVQTVVKDYNVVFVLDVSGSMAGSRLDILKSSVANLLQNFNNYDGGNVKVFISPFATESQGGQAFDVSTPAGLNAALNYLNGLSADGFTNYEAPLQTAISWLQSGEPISGADTYTYFITDGEPNRYVDANGNDATGNTSQVLGQITGSDGTNEVEILKGLSTEVIGVGISVGSNALNVISTIDSDGVAIDVRDPNDLDSALQNSNPIQGSTTGNVITGLNGGAGAADNLSNDTDNVVTKVTFNGTVYDVSASGTTINGQYGTLVIRADGSYSYKLGNNLTPGAAIQDVFYYTLTDGDGDNSTAKLTIQANIPADDHPVISAVETLVVDESDLNPTDHDGGQITADFGNDGPGEYLASGSSTFTYSGAKGSSLTSHGVPVTVSLEGNDYVGKANGTEVFRLSLNASTGTYRFTLSGVLDHADANNPDDVIKLNFGVTVKDADGDLDAGTITVDVKDDGPVAVADAQTLEEGTSVNGNVMSNDDVGADVAGTITAVNFNGTNYNVSAGGTTINGQYGTLVIRANGSYNYTAKNVATSGQDVFTYTLKDYDGDAATAKLTLSVSDKDDVPVISKITPLSVDETDLNPTDNDFGTITASFGEDGPGEYLVGNPNSFSYSGQAGTKLTSNGVEVKLSVSGNDYVGMAGSTEVFRLVLNKTTGAYEFVLKDQLDHGNPNNPDDTITLNFQVAVKDADGDTTTGNITVGVKDDGPVAVDDANTLAQNATQVSGNVIANDDVGADLAGKITKISFNGTEKTVVAGTSTTINGAYGKLVINADGTYKYTTNGGNTSAVSDQFTYTLSDADGDTDTAILKINVNDIDDKPTLATPAPLVVDETDLNPTDSDSDTVTATFGNDGPGQYVVGGANTVSYSGQAGTKLTSNGVAVVISVSGNDYVGTAGGKEVFRLSLNQTTGQYTFTLKDQLDHANPNNPNDVITLNFGVNAKDADGDIDSGHIVVSVYDDGPDAVNDLVTFDAGDLTATGNVIANDDVGADAPGHVTKVVFGGTEYTVSGNDATIINTGSATLAIKADGSYTYTLNSAAANNLQQSFTYTLSDADGDKDTATLSFKPLNPVLIVGSNDDDSGTTGPDWTVGDGEGTITGGQAGDILVGDYGGSNQIAVNKDYNFLFVLDVSGSMEANTPLGTRIQLLIDAVQNLVTDFGAYKGGEVMVHFAPFSTTAEAGATFKVTDAGGLQAAIAWLEGLEPNGLTNYEAALQSGIDWLQSGEPIPGAETITYFVSDGEPNRYVTPQDDSNSGSAAEVMAQVTGSDGSNEVAIIQGLSDEVIGVGIDINSSIANINIIDSDGKSLNIEDPTELNAALAGSNPINRNIAVGDDTLNGGDGDDLIFGDALYTDALAANQGLSTHPGAGWEVFERLENGEGSKANWTRADTIDYIKAHAAELAQESLNTSTDQAGRQGGHDVLNGGAGDDIIFGQEGNDIINGGAGNDHLYGGSGDDIFLFEAGHGVDTIHDFELGHDVLDISGLLQGYDALQDSINDFVFATEVNGNTVISVDANGSAGGSNAVTVAILQSVTGLDLNDIATLTNNGETKV